MINSSSERTHKRGASQLSYFISSVCLLHCLLMPFVIILLPAFSAFFNDTLETILLLSVIPVSLYAFIPTWLNHKNGTLAIFFLVGLVMILIAQFGIQHVHFNSIQELITGSISNPIVIVRLLVLIVGVIILSAAVYKNNKHTHVCHNPHHHH